ncbi:unnamed protein product [Parnassius mnemosyne]|uniref:Uncharacterized protein n=1 Tax=Parnassius mnemosyne TaxID=213953 RepID=A0AAV1KJ26_9NEOP
MKIDYYIYYIILLFFRDICEQLLHMLQPNNTGSSNGPRKVLDAPIHLASMTTTNNETDDLKSIWLQTRDDNFVSKTYPLVKKMLNTKLIKNTHNACALVPFTVHLELSTQVHCCT